jgi:hypothetical protein
VSVASHPPACRCGSTECEQWEDRLRDDDLAHLDSEDYAGRVFVSRRGSPDPRPERVAARDAAEGEVVRRRQLLDRHDFKSKLDRRVYALHVQGLPVREIGKRVHRGFGKVAARIRRIEHEYEMTKDQPLTDAQLRALLKESDPSLLVIFFALIRRAIESPDEMRAFLDAASAIPDLRELVDPEPLS